MLNLDSVDAGTLCSLFEGNCSYLDSDPTPIFSEGSAAQQAYLPRLPSAVMLNTLCIQPLTASNMLQVAAALIPLSQALYANGDLEPARETCTRALKILQMAYGQSPSVEVSNT